MKSKIYLIVIFLIFISGCIPLYIELATPKTDIITKSGSYEIKFFVNNPTDNTFTGNVEYQLDKKSGECLSIWTKSENIEIPPRGRIAKNKQINYQKPKNEDECLNEQLRVTIQIKDKSGDIKGTKDVLLTVSQ